MRLENILQQTTPVRLDKPRRMLITLNSLAEVETTTGRSILIPGDLGKPSAKILFTMIAAFCRHEDPEVTVAQIARGFNMQRMPELMKAITGAWEKNAAGTPAAKADPTGNFPPAALEAVSA